MSTPTTLQTLPIILTTRSPTYSIPTEKYLIPSSWKRFQLSQLINKVLALPSPVPFDFVVDGEILRSSLAEWVKEREGKGESRGTEETLEIEYIESVLPPQHVSSFEHDDWVSSVSVGKPGIFLTGCYDSRLRLFSSSQTLLTSIFTGSHTGGITSVSWLPSLASSSSPEEEDFLAAGSMDGITRVYSLPSLSPSSLPSDSLPSKSLMSLHHHTSAISSIAASPSSSSSSPYLLTSSWDSTIALFPLSPLPTSHDASVPPPLQMSNKAAKRRKMDKSVVEEEGVAADGFRVGPEVVFKGHQGRVGKAIWDKNSMGGEKIWSCGWDGSVRGFDVESQINFLTKQAPSDKICLDMDQMAGGSSMLVTSHADRTVCLWDTRDDTSIISLTLPSAHTSFIPFVRAHPTSPHLIATGGHDGQLKIFDIRSPKQALLGVQRDYTKQEAAGGKKKEKLLAGDWDGEILAVGGEGCELEVYRGKV